MVVFSRLPDECQLVLFKQLPPREQLRFRSVCRKWNTLIPIAASTRRSLTIFLGGRYRENIDYFDQYDPVNQRTMRLLTNKDGSPMFPRKPPTIWNSLHFNRLLEKNNAHLIPTTFAGVEHLEGIITQQDPNHLVLIAKLLELWRHQLVSVHLTEYITVPSGMNIEAATRLLYEAINSLSSVKRLVLHLEKLRLQDLPVIGRLEELDVIAYIPSGTRRQTAKWDGINPPQLLEMLQKYGRLEQGLPRVGYTNHYKRTQHLGPIVEGVINMRHIFTRFDVCDLSRPELPIMCNFFDGLTSIRFGCGSRDIALVPLFQELSKLKQLIYLYLGISIFEPPNDHHHPLPRLPSVKALVLYLKLDTPQHMAFLDIGWLFPNLQVIEFILLQIDNFPGCGFIEVRFLTADLELTKECFRQLFRPLKRHFGDQLTILHNMEKRINIGSAKKLLAAI